MPKPANAIKTERCGKAGPPNSGSSPLVFGYMIADIPASQYIEPVNIAVRSESASIWAAAAGKAAGKRVDRQVKNSVAVPKTTEREMV